MRKIAEIYNELISINDNNEHQRINELLVEIGKALLNSIILIGGKEIEPVWVEAYFDNPYNDYGDPIMYATDGQRGDERYYHIFKLPKNNNFRGRDIVIGDNSNYKLSFLLKVIRIDEKVYKQAAGADEIDKYSGVVEVKEGVNDKDLIVGERKMSDHPRGNRDRNKEQIEMYRDFPLAVYEDWHFKFRIKAVKSKHRYNRIK